MTPPLTALAALAAALTLTQGGGSGGGRVCRTPDCLIVSNVHSAKGRVTSIGVRDTRLHLYVYVPSGVPGFTLGVYDQPDDVPGATPSHFTLYGPDGRERKTLTAGRTGDWADYPVTADGEAGIWRLTVTGPEDREDTAGAAPPKAENAFLVRTAGDVDLYLRPESAAARVRGVRFGAPRFGGAAAHSFLLSAPPGAESLRLNVLHGEGVRRSALSLVPLPPTTARFTLNRGGLDDDDRLAKGAAFSTLDLAGQSLAGLWRFTVPAAEGVWGVGSDASTARFFCGAEEGGDAAAPRLPAPVLTPITVAGGPARVTVTCARSAEPPVTGETDARGRAVLPLLPGLGPYAVEATRGFEYAPSRAAILPGKATRLTLTRRVEPLPGWLPGDTHCHTSYYDGSDTPAALVAAARAEGLSWLFVTEHGHGTRLERTEKASAEAQAAAAGSGLLVLPGMEYTGPSFHANVFGGFVRLPAGATLGQVIGAARAADRPGAPVVASLNHPTIGKTAEGIARESAAGGLPLLVELWNSPEPGATQLWWDLLSAGHRVFAVTGSDSHHKIGAPLGYRRVYVHLGKDPLTGPNVVRALREGRSFLSRGALLDFRLGDARPGGSIVRRPGRTPLRARVEVRAASPLSRVEIVRNGRVLRSFPLAGKTRAVLAVDLPDAAPGWYLARAWGADEKADFGPQPLALTNPIFVKEGAASSGETP